MKKKLFNSKRKLLSLIALAVLLAFVISSSILACIAYDEIKFDFDKYTSNLLNNIDGYYKDYSNPEECLSPEHFLDIISNHQLYRYPTAIALYNKNGEFIHANGTLLTFRNEDEDRCICFLDEYISDVDYDRLLEFTNEATGKYVLPINIKYYYDEKGNIVPVYCLFVHYDCYNMQFDEIPDNKKLEITFDVDKVTEVKEVGEATMNSLKMGAVYWMDTELYIGKYHQLIEKVKSEELRKTAFESFSNCIDDEGNVSSHSVSRTKDFHCYVYANLVIANEPYFAVYASYYNPFIEVWDECGEWIQILALNFLVFGAIIIFATSKYYDKNKTFEESKLAFISAMTHEMKTPIAIIQNQCECVLENIAPEKNEEYLKSIYDETQKMDKLVTDMLQYNRIATNGNVNVEKCNLSDIVKEETEKYKKQFELHEKNVTLNIKENAIVKCDKNLISLVVDNMLSNTIKHTENGGEVIVTVKDGVEGYKVSVYNSGSTMPENEKDKIWSVLYKTDKSRTDRDKSSGVGLAVSAKILDSHKANYGCLNVNNGVEFYFTIK